MTVQPYTNHQMIDRSPPTHAHQMLPITIGRGSQVFWFIALVVIFSVVMHGM